MLNQVNKPFNEINKGDILVLIDNMNKNHYYIVMEIDHKEKFMNTFALTEKESMDITVPKDQSNFCVACNSFNLHQLLDENLENFRWIGIQYGRYRFLIDIFNSLFEIYNKEYDEWTFKEPNNIDICFGKNLDYINIDIKDEFISFLIDTSTLTVFYKTKDSILREYDLYTIKNDGEFAFDTNNEIII